MRRTSVLAGAPSTALPAAASAGSAGEVAVAVMEIRRRSPRGGEALAVCALFLLAGLAIGVAGCGGGSAPAPACVSTGCTAIVCGGVDNCGNVCAPGSGCIPVTGSHRVEGGITGGAAAASAAGAYQVRGAVGSGSQHAVAGPNHRIEQGTLH